MSYNKIIERLEVLHNVLAYCSDLQSGGRIYVFKTEERICLNQERGSLLSQLSQLNGHTFPHEVRDYQCPPSIEAKIKFTIEKIQATNWGGIQIEQFLNL